MLIDFVVNDTGGSCHIILQNGGLMLDLFQIVINFNPWEKYTSFAIAINDGCIFNKFELIHYL